MNKLFIFGTLFACGISNSQAADCDPNFACADLTLIGTVSPSIPIIYRPGSGWENSSELQDTIAFGDFDATTMPQPIEYPITLGTLDTNLSAGLYLSVSSSNTAHGQYFNMSNGNIPADYMPYVVNYTGCNNSDSRNSEDITPDGSITPQSIFFPQTVIGMAGPNPACHPANNKSTAGSGSGKLTFSLVQPNAGVFAAGQYQDTLTITVCTSDPCT